MHRSNRVAVMVAAALGAGAATTSAQSSGGQATPASAGSSRQVVLTGCLRQMSDDERVFSFVPSPDTGTTQGTSGPTPRSPLYRLAHEGQDLKGHLGHRIEVTGRVTPAKDETGAEIVMTRSENIGVDTKTVTTIDLRPAPRLDVTSVRTVAGTCPAPSGPTAASATAASGNAAPAAATVGAISEHPGRHIGQTVTVTGEVERVYSAHVFSLDEDRVFSTGVDVLVLGKRPGIAKDDQRMTVTGTVRQFVGAELQREIVDFDLRPEWLVDFEARPVIIATSVAVAQ